MKRTLKRVKHLWKAKGRHGTHSPFVYAFVEQVMRSGKQFLRDTPSGLLNRQQVNVTGRTIQYLQATTVYADTSLLDAVSAISKEITPAIKVLPLDDSTKEYEPGACFVCLPTVATIQLMNNIAARQTCSVIIPLQQTAADEMAYWEKLRLEPAFKMVMNAWYIGFLSNHPDFKIKQYFLLR